MTHMRDLRGWKDLKNSFRRYRPFIRKTKLSDIAGNKTITKKDWEKVKKKFRIQEELNEIRRRYLLELIKG